MQICFSISGGDDVELPTTLEEAKAWTRSLITEVPIPEGWFTMLDMLEEVQESMTCSQVRFGTPIFLVAPWVKTEAVAIYRTVDVDSIRERCQPAVELDCCRGQCHEGQSSPWVRPSNLLLSCGL